MLPEEPSDSQFMPFIILRKGQWFSNKPTDPCPDCSIESFNIKG